jgi:cytochrome c553
MRRSSLTLLVLVLSCAHAPASEGPPPDDGSPVVTPAEVPWKDMTKAQRGRYMRKVVTPKMREVFQAYDAEHFAKFGCATCHGKDAKQREFKMPGPDLMALPDSHEVFMATVMKEKPEIVKFMGEKVEPMTAELLGLKPFNPAAPDESAFGCSGCHRLEHVAK